MLTDYMMINMMHLLITMSTQELVEAFRKHVEFVPAEDKLEALEVDAALEGERPKDAPQVSGDCGCDLWSPR